MSWHLESLHILDNQNPIFLLRIRWQDWYHSQVRALFLFLVYVIEVQRGGFTGI